MDGSVDALKPVSKRSFEPPLVANGEAELEYLRMQIIAFEDLKVQSDRMVPDYYDSFTERQYRLKKDHIDAAIEKRYHDIITVAEDVLRKKFEGDNKARVIAMIVKAIGGLQTQPPQIIDRTDRVNVLR